MGDLERYFGLLEIEKKEPNLAFLRELTRVHLERVPYENLSKIVRYGSRGAGLPNLGEFLDGIERFGFGGTCFAQNRYFGMLLKGLGFEVREVPIDREGMLGHISLRVRIDGRNYFVDLGAMSSFAGPYLLDPTAAIDRWIGDQRFEFSPFLGGENYLLNIYRDGKLIRSFTSSSDPLNELEFDRAVSKTFEPDALFMKVLCVHRVFGEKSVGIWNRNFYRIRGDQIEKRQIANFEELEQVFRDELRMPLCPLREVVRFLGGLEFSKI